MEWASFEGDPSDLKSPGVTVEAVPMVLAVEALHAPLAGAKALMLAVDHAGDGAVLAH
jgi:hypothetical protein